MPADCGNGQGKSAEPISPMSVPVNVSCSGISRLFRSQTEATMRNDISSACQPKPSQDVPAPNENAPGRGPGHSCTFSTTSSQYKPTKPSPVPSSTSKYTIE